MISLGSGLAIANFRQDRYHGLTDYGFLVRFPWIKEIEYVSRDREATLSFWRGSGYVC